ncbi:hypothetical protein [Bacillus thuringiensis]|uniref:hypothetical protein n=1 Tax=Bacillus thuringiensis TaxID=1428 RepID=UPI000BFCA58B|nr:hypothetical protein [Bacillus thuringiensis]PGT89870.1 hypothetical protein COD17_08965 [Bacillus thuringiensis]
MSGQKRVVEFWQIQDQLFHRSDEERAEHYKKHNELQEDVKKVYAGVPADYFVGTVQHIDCFEGWVFNTDTKANEEVEAYNKRVS